MTSLSGLLGCISASGVDAKVTGAVTVRNRQRRGCALRPGSVLVIRGRAFFSSSVTTQLGRSASAEFRIFDALSDGNTWAYEGRTLELVEET